MKRRLINPLLALLKAGITPEKLALTVSLGAVIGVIPAIGAATVICTLIAAKFKLNAPAMLLISYFVNPIQIVIALPLIKLGFYLFGNGELHYTLEQMLAMFKRNWLEALDKLWVANLMGIGAWALLALPLGALLYFFTLPLFRRVVRQQVPAV